MHRQIRTLLALIMTLGLVLGPVATARPAGATTTVITLTIGNPNITVNGTPKPIDASGTTPVIVGGRTLLPIRAIVEALGGTIGWNATTRTVTISVDVNTLELVIGNRMATVNGAKVAIDAANAAIVPAIVGGRTMLPVRFVGEQLGGVVEWSQATKTATLTFMTGIELTAPRLLEPTDAGMFTSATITFRWTPVTYATSYTLVITSGSTQIFRGVSTTTSFSPSSTMLAAGTYSWAVSAAAGSTTGPMSLTSRFTVKLPMSPADIVKKVTPSVAGLSVQFPDGRQEASGAFFIESNGVLVATYSAIKGAVDCSVLLSDGTVRDHPRVLGYSPSANVAILSTIGGDPVTALQMSEDQSAQANQDVVMVGPLVSGTAQQTLVGVVNGVTPGGFTMRSAGLDAVEGAPVFNSFGEVLGMMPTNVPVSPGTYSAIFATAIRSVARTGSWTLREVTEREGTDPQALAVPSLVQPIAGSTVASLTPEFRWNPVSNATQYHFWVGEERNTTGDGVVSAIIDYTDLQILPGVLKPSTTYTWAVRAGNERGWGPWSPNRVFVVSSFITQPAVPVPLEPPADVVVKASSPIFCWEAVPNAAKYFIRVITSTGESTYSTSTDTTSIIVPAGTLVSGTEYSWSLRAEDASGVSSLWSAKTAFAAAFPSGLGVASLISPAPKALITALNPTLVWQEVPTATTYDVAVYEKTSSTAAVKIFEQAVSATSLALPVGVLRQGTLYSWTVIAGTSAGWSKTGDVWNWSLPRSFSVSTNAVAVLVPPVLLEPVDGATSSSLLPVLTWKSIVAASWYRVYVGKGTSEASLVPVLNKVTTPAAGDTQQYAVPIGTLERGATYYWRVYAGAGLETVSSPFARFTTAP
jgi:hypothetical protein